MKNRVTRFREAKRKIRLKILDLFAGIGCSAREFQKTLDKYEIRYVYVAVEISPEIAKVHRKIATKSDIIVANAMDFLHPSFLSKFDFVWASPPCQKYSMAYRIKRNDYGKDDTLLRVIEALKRSKTLYVIENVKSPCTLKLKPDLIIGRHVFWTNVEFDTLLPDVNYSVFTKIKNRATDLAKAYGIPLELLNGIKDKRKALRNCLEPWIARAIFSHVVRVLVKLKSEVRTEVVS